MKFQQESLKLKLKSRKTKAKPEFTSYVKLLDHMVATGRRIMESRSQGRCVGRYIIGSDGVDLIPVHRSCFKSLVDHQLIDETSKAYSGDERFTHYYEISKHNLPKIYKAAKNGRLRKDNVGKKS